MSDLQIFKNDDFGEIRTATIDMEPWFVGKDVAKILGYTNPSKALSDHVDNEDKLNNESLSSLGQRGGWFINESGLYSLILSSKLPAAKKFKRWITSEVLPVIRKTGGYVNNDETFINTYLPFADENTRLLFKATLQTMREQSKTIEKQKNKIDILNNENAVLMQENLEWEYRPLINSLVRRYASYEKNGDFSKAWVDYKKELLYKHGINLNMRKTCYLNTTGKRTSPKTLSLLEDEELPIALSSIVAMCRECDIDIDDLLNNVA